MLAWNQQMVLSQSKGNKYSFTSAADQTVDYTLPLESIQTT